MDPNTGNGRALPVASVRFLLRDSVLYGFANALVKLSALVSVPILTRSLSREQFGASDSISVLLTLFVASSTLGQDSAVARFFYEVETETARRQVVTQALVIQTAMSVFATVLAFVLGRWITNTALVTAHYAPAYFIAVAALPFVLLFQFWRGLLKWTLARERFVILTVGSAFTNVAIIVVLASVNLLDVQSFFAALLITNVIYAALGLLFCRSYITRPAGFNFARPLLRYGWPYALVLLASAAFPALDRSIVTNQLGLGQLGNYAVGLKYASLLLFPIMAFQTAWGPFCFATYKEATASAVYSRVLTLFTSGIAFVCFLLVAFAEPAITLFASAKYTGAGTLVVPLVFGLSAEAISWIVGIGVDLSKRTELSLISYVVGLALSAGLAWLLVRPLGILGVAIGMSLGKVVQSIAYSVLGMRAYPMRLYWQRPLAAYVLALCLSIAVSAGQTSSIGWTVAIRLTSAAILLTLIYHSYSSIDRAYITKNLLRFGRTSP